MDASPNDCIFTVSQGGVPKEGGGVSQGRRKNKNLPEGSSGARKGPRSIFFSKSEVATEVVASSIHRIFTGSRDHLDGRKNALKKNF